MRATKKGKERVRMTVVPEERKVGRLLQIVLMEEKRTSKRSVE